jgi:hypothetical protein
VDIFASACPHWSFRSITEGGHMAPLTRPELINPIVRGGRFVALSEQKGRHERVLLHDLAQGGTAPIAEMPLFWRHCQPPLAILDDRILCVHEAEGEPVEGGTVFAREIVALRTRTGERSWSAAIAPRLLPAPVPGGGR